MSFRTIIFRWEASERVMRPLPRFHNALEQYRDGEDYPLEVREHRSSASHAHLFACVNEAWKNLRGAAAERLDTPNKLRGWALIMAGYHHESITAVPDRQIASDIARSLAEQQKRMREEGYVEIAAVRMKGHWYVRTRVPRSMSRASMNKEEFEQCKRDLLDILSGEISVTRRALAQAGKSN